MDAFFEFLFEILTEIFCGIASSLKDKKTPLLAKFFIVILIMLPIAIIIGLIIYYAQ